MLDAGHPVEMVEPPPYSLEDEAVDDHVDDVSLLDAQDSPGTLDSPPPYSVEDVEAAPSVPIPYSQMEQMVQSETENETSMPPGAAPDHTSE